MTSRLDDSGKRKFINFFRSYMDALDTIKDPGTYKEATTAILHYAFDRQEPPAALSDIANMAFILVKPTIDKGFTSQENGGKRPANNQTRVDPQATDSKPKVDPQATDTQQRVNNRVEDKGKRKEEKEKEKGNNTFAHPDTIPAAESEKPPEKEKAETTEPETDQPEYEKIFAALWELYPRKKGKGNVKTAQKKKIAKIGIEEMTRAIERYKEQIRTHKTDIDHVQYGGTFFNSGYIDYLDANYQKEAAATPTVKPGSFGNFTQRNHDDSYYDELQKDLIAASLKHTAESEGT